VWYHILRQIDPPTLQPVDIPARKNPGLAARVFDGALTAG
jgi:hypothetical protein